MRHVVLTITIGFWTFYQPTMSWAADSAPRVDGGKLVMTVRSNNEFACDLYRAAATQEGNLFFSPTSIATVLGMIAEGAKGQTKSEFQEVLHLSPASGSGTVEANFAGLLDKSGDGFRLKSANRIWGRIGLNINPEFRDAISKNYAADFEELDFSKPNDVQEKLNDWVDDKTNGKISNLFAGPLKPNVQLIATNAIYFKGNWMHRFDPKLTKNRKFYVRGKKEAEVPTMAITGRFRFWENAMIKMIELPYEGDVFSAVILLPSEGDGLPALQKQVTGPNLEKWLTSLDGSLDPKSKEPPEVTVRLPRFSLATDLQLNDVLQKMGLMAAFGEHANLTGIASGESLFLAAVVHKAFVQVDEKGTVATAVTGGVVGSSIPPSFIADHPFLFMIRERKNNAIVFFGRLDEPGEHAAK